MGMYDIIFVEITCPKCELLVEVDCQTKQGLKTLSSYAIGDKFTINKEHKELEEQSYRLRSKNMDKGEPAYNRYLIWVLGSCPNCRCHLEGCAYIDRTSSTIMEVNLFKYSVDIEPEIVVRKNHGKL